MAFNGGFRDKVSLLLAGLEEGREVRAYLRQFSQQKEGCFAVVKVGGAVVAHDIEPLADALALLGYLGLPPVVVFGAGPQLNDDLEKAGFATKRVDELRVTPNAAMPYLASAVGAMGTGLVSALCDRGAASAMMPPGTILAKMINEARYGAVGAVGRVDAEAIQQLLSAGVIPLIGCLHADDQGQMLNVNADGVAKGIAAALQPQKVVYVTGTGGLLGADGRVVDSINLAEEGESISQAPWLQGGMAHKFREIIDLLAELPLSSSVSITGARGLVRELFTHTGSGTLVRRGEAIFEVNEIDEGSLSQLIEAAFKKKLKPHYWEDLNPSSVLLSERHRAGAILEAFGGVTLLDKFAVDPSARGEGLAKSLWTKMTTLAPQLIWRSRRANPFNSFYANHADGFVRRGDWTVFWVGQGLETRIAGLADELASRPGDFEGEE